MEAGKFDVLLFAKHRLYPPALQPRNGWHDRMFTRNKGTYSCLSYNTNDGEGTKWNQYGGTGITLNANLKSRMTTSGSGGDPTKLGRWTWVRIGEKDGIATVFVSAYRPCKNTSGLHTVWSQQERYFKEHEDIESPDVHTLFIRDLCKFLGELRDAGNHVVLGMDANDDIRDGTVTKALSEVGIFEAVVSNHGGESVPATCATNKQRKPIDSIWTSPGLTVLKCGFLPFHEIYGFNSDHRLIWADICNEDLLGHRPQYIYRASGSRVKSNDPDTRERYIQRCLEKYEQADIITDYET